MIRNAQPPLLSARESDNAGQKPRNSKSVKNLCQKPLASPRVSVSNFRPFTKPFDQSQLMPNSIPKMLILSVLTAALAVMPAQLHAQTTNKAPSAKPAAKKSRSIPFSGTVTAIDKSAKTLKVDKRILQITSETKILKADKPAMLENGAVGDYVTGSYQKADDGRLLAHSIYFGGKTKTTTAETKK
jgi:hypothetical protein